jgi:hypothetical protein
MAGINGGGFITAADLYSSTATPGDNMMVGQYFVDSKTGKGFRYTLNGAVAMVKGNVYQAAVEDVTYENMAVGTAGTAGDKFIQVTNGTATVTEAQFKGGSLTVYTAGTITIGDEYTIVGLSGTLTTGGAMYVWLDRPLRAAITTSAKVTMKRSPWSGVVSFPTTATEMVAGIAIHPVAASEYGWLQTHGPCAINHDNVAFLVGSDFGVPGSTTGLATFYTAPTGAKQGMRIGYARASCMGSAGHALAGFLQID